VYTLSCLFEGSKVEAGEGESQWPQLEHSHEPPQLPIAPSLQLTQLSQSAIVTALLGADRVILMSFVDFGGWVEDG